MGRKVLQKAYPPQIPHFIRISSEVMLFSFEKQSSKKTSSVNQIMVSLATAKVRRVAENNFQKNHLDNGLAFR